MKEPNELERVLEQAVEAYLICQKRNTARGKKIGDLSKKYPDHFKRLENDKFRWIGKSPDDIIEEYLLRLGYAPASKLWHQLCDMVVRRSRRTANED